MVFLGLFNAYFKRFICYLKFNSLIVAVRDVMAEHDERERVDPARDDPERGGGSEGTVAISIDYGSTVGCCIIEG